MRKQPKKWAGTNPHLKKMLLKLSEDIEGLEPEDRWILCCLLEREIHRRGNLSRVIPSADLPKVMSLGDF